MMSLGILATCLLGIAMTGAGCRVEGAGYAGTSRDVLQSCLNSHAGALCERLAEVLAYRLERAGHTSA
jgi:hypothetical protein